MRIVIRFFTTQRAIKPSIMRSGGSHRKPTRPNHIQSRDRGRDDHRINPVEQTTVAGNDAARILERLLLCEVLIHCVNHMLMQLILIHQE